MPQFKIGSCLVGNGAPVYFVADVASNHNGNLQKAVDLIYLAKESGANAVKFQNFRAETIISKLGFSRIGNTGHQAAWKKDVYSVYEDYSVPVDWIPYLKSAADRAGIEFFSTPYDLEMIGILSPHVNVFKIGSGDITWHELISRAVSRKKPVILSTGAASYVEVSSAVDILHRGAFVDSGPSAYCLMQCNTNYTGRTENIQHANLNVLKTYAKAFPDAVLGLSDHSNGYTAVLGAIALGARIIEKHLTDNQDQIGPDHRFAEIPASWKEMIARTRDLESALGDRLKRIEENEGETVIIQRRGLYATRIIEAGEIIARDDLIPLRPSLPEHISVFHLESVVGQRANKRIIKDNPISFEDILR